MTFPVTHLVQVVGPPLHHCPALIRVSGVVGIGSPDTVAFHVLHLALDGIRLKPDSFKTEEAVARNPCGTALRLPRNR